MNIPEYADTAEFMRWARENKRRADRLLRAVRAATTECAMPSELFTELCAAATDYEDTRG